MALDAIMQTVVAISSPDEFLFMMDMDLVWILDFQRCWIELRFTV